MKQLRLLEFGNWNLFVIWCLVLGIFVVFPSEAKAGVIIQRPLYIGLTNGLVGYWSFDAPDMAGVAAYDRSGNNNTGTLTNGPTRQIGKIGQALNFDGGDDYVVVPSTATLEVGSPSSFSAWINIRWGTETVNPAILSYRDSGGTRYSFHIGLNVGETTHFGLWNGTSYLQSIGSAVSKNVWHLWTAVVSGSQTTFYIDGVQFGTPVSVVPSAATGKPFNIGWSTAANEQWTGFIDEVRIYNRALAPDEIKRLYNMGATTKFNVSKKQDPSLNQGLVGLWTFDAPDMAGVAAYDRSGNSNSGTLTNGPTRQIGKIGQALNFDGVNDYVNILDYPNFTLSNSFTLSAWVYPLQAGGSATDSGDTILGKTSSFGVNGMEMEWVWTNAVKPAVQWYGSGFTYGPANSYPTANKWNHMVAIYNGTNVTYYLNGVYDGGFTPTNAPPNTVFVLRLGTINQRVGGYELMGSLDEVRIYNRALSPDEIKRLYNMGATTKFNVSKKQDPSLNQGLVGLWTFDAPDMAGVAAYDRSGNSNSGTLTNGPTRQIGKIGQALNFDGVDDYIDILGVPQLGIGTMALWLKADTLPPAFQIDKVITYYEQAQAEEFTTFDKQIYLYPDGTGVCIKGYVYDGASKPIPSATCVNSTGYISANTWYHVALTFDGTTATLYINGVKDSSRAAGATYTAYSNPAMRIAGKSGAVDGETTRDRIDGIVDDVRIYNRALMPDEIKRLYNMGR